VRPMGILRTTISNQPRGDSGQYYERRGRQATKRIANAVAGKSWKWTLVNLAWTVGPVTFIALQLGSYVGLGKIAANETFIYFAVYTLVAGMFAAIASVLHDAFHKPKVANEAARFLQVTDKLHHLMLATRNAILDELEPNERRIMAAYYILAGAGVHPSAVGNAVYDLTQNPDLARFSRRVDVFMEQGMTGRVHEEWDEIAPLLEPLRAELEPVAPQAYTLLEERLRGNAPLVQQGIERTDGFIARTLAAADAEDESLMTLHDAYEMLTLAFEMLNGRKIAMLDTRFEGDGAFERAQRSFDEALQEFRIALRRRNSRIRLLAERLYTETQADGVADAADSVSRMIEMMCAGLRQLDGSEQRHYRRAYDEILRRHKRAMQLYKDLVRTEKTYRRIWEKESQKIKLRVERKGLRRSGFVIIEQEIALLDKQKLRLSQGIDALLSEVEIRTGRYFSVYDMSHENRIMRFVADDYKQLAMGVASLLDDVIDLSQPEEQLAIESSNMGNFGSIEIDLSPQTKAGWATLSVDALHTNRRKASHRLARNLMQIYRVALSDEMKQYFVDHFGADEHYLDLLSIELHNDEQQHQGHLPEAPYPLPRWQQLFDDPYKINAYG
jgi:hypothetical protein